MKALMIILSFLIGFGLMIIGFMYIIVYLNLLTVGYNFLDYVNFIIRRFECYYSIIGFLIIFMSISIGGKKDELHL